MYRFWVDSAGAIYTAAAVRSREVIYMSAPATTLCALMRIGTRAGVRLEHLREWVCEDNDVVLGAHNGFSFRTSCGVSVRVGGWDAAACSVSPASAAHMLLGASSTLKYDGSCSEPEHSSDAAAPSSTTPKKKRSFFLLIKKRRDLKATTAMVRRMAVSASAPLNKKRRRCTNRCFMPPPPLGVKKAAAQKKQAHIEIFLQDAEEDVLYVWIISFPSHCLMGRMAILPHPYCAFSVENCCGSCTGLFDVDFAEIKRMMAVRTKRAGCDVISTLGGTLSLCPERFQIDFRGTRSMRLLAADWGVITRKPLQETSVSAYMLVLKGRLGAAILLNEEPPVPPPSWPIVDAGGGCCYLVNRMQMWCAEVRRQDDVCATVELRGIRWDALFAHTRVIAAPLLKGSCSVYISRRGGVMMRLLFPARTPWSIALEDAVLSDCNALLQILRAAVGGRPMF